MRIYRLVEIATLAMSGLLVAFAASWLVLSQLNFSYGVWHDYAGIAGAIERYAPTNDYKKDFALTTKAQRERLFGEINSAIHNHGKGLAEITFKVDGQPEQTLLREPEITHLQDVANLIDFGKSASIFIACVWLFMWFYFAYSKKRVPKLWQQAVAIGVVLGVIGTVTILVGPVNVFYWLHTVIFPDDHQWFFYYQESLMSTMMYAPILFGWIALEWVALALLMFIALQGAGLKLLNIYRLGR